MKKREEQPLRLLINQMLRSYGYGKQLDEIGLIKSWDEVVGPMISKHTKDLSFKDGKLIVTIDSAPLRQELSFSKSKLMLKLNEHAGKTLVNTIVFR